MIRNAILLITVFIIQALPGIVVAGQPLKVFILAGQSNMQGHAQVGTIEHIGMDARTAPMLEELCDDHGQPKTCDEVWISSIGHDGGEKERHGLLTPDYGAAGHGPKIGPEYAFGIYAYELLDQPILIIKTAWGGKSLHTDFRPPSAGPYVFREEQFKNFEKQGKDVNAIRSAKKAATGQHYRLMMDHVTGVLADIRRIYPDYDANAGFELAGFVWFQGWNDMVDGGVYPNRAQSGGYQAYSDVLGHFIRDVRRDLAAPNLPFVIGVMGVGGPVEDYGPQQQRYATTHHEFRSAMAAPAALPEFEGNVVAVWTEKYWDPQLGELSQRWNAIHSQRRSLNQDPSLTEEERKEALETFQSELFSPEELAILQAGKSNAEFHYLGSAKILSQIGKAFAEAVVALSPQASASS